MLVDVYLSTAQLRKLNSGKPFQLPASALQKPKSRTLAHHVELEITDSAYKKLEKNIKMDKGFRFQPDMVVGAGWKEDLLDSLGTAKDFVYENAGKAANNLKRLVPKESVKNAVGKAADFVARKAGKPEFASVVKSALNKGVDSAYDYDFEQPPPSRAQVVQSGKDYLKNNKGKFANMAKNAVGSRRVKRVLDRTAANLAERTGQPGIVNSIRNKAAEAVDKAFDYDYEQGAGMGGHGKGSEFMKQKMARLRAMRKMKTGGNLAGDVVDVANIVGKEFGLGMSGKEIASKYNCGDMKEKMATLRAMRGKKGRGKKRKGGDLLDDLAKAGQWLQDNVLEPAGEPFKETVGVNPAKLGYDIGYNYLGPAIERAIEGGGHKRGHTARVPVKYSQMLGGVPIAKRRGGSFASPN